MKQQKESGEQKSWKSAIDWQRNKRFLIVGFAVVTVLSCLIFFSMSGYIYRENGRAMRAVGEIYMDEISTQMQRHFRSIISLRIAQVESLIRRIEPSAYSELEGDLDAEFDLSGRARAFEVLALCAADGPLGISLRRKLSGDQRVELPLQAGRGRAAHLAGRHGFRR